ncbi:acyl-CoA binding domain-containing protein 6 [Polyrhizophydium stewartii]|uniref:Acyl-CoA binding domain-containing protein 6 n=1 Tax=Polyrhizophydium stewartii TaxID=2732419 RepID=A0ABR4N6V0_9FUNG
MTELDDAFDAAAKRLASSARRPDNETLLKLYSLFKVATVGRCNTPRPGLFDFQGRAKWDAWNALGDTDPVTAKQLYVQLVDVIAPAGDASAAVAQAATSSNDEDLDNLSDDDRGGSSATGGGPSASGFHVSQMANMREEIDDADKTVFDWAEEGNVEQVRRLIELGADVNAADGEGMTLLHWAADRDYTALAAALLELGADVDRQDASGQTPLHYALIVEGLTAELVGVVSE